MLTQRNTNSSDKSCVHFGTRFIFLLTVDVKTRNAAETQTVEKSVEYSVVLSAAMRLCSFVVVGLGRKAFNRWSSASCRRRPREFEKALARHIFRYFCVNPSAGGVQSPSGSLSRTTLPLLRAACSTGANESRHSFVCHRVHIIDICLFEAPLLTPDRWPAGSDQ